MSTLRISNIEAKADNSSPTVDEQLKITNSSGDLMLYLDGRTSGITTVGINTTNQTIKFDENNNVYITGIVTATELHGTVAVGTSVTYGDDEKAYFGTGLDLEVYHGNGHSRIVNNFDGGSLKLQSNQIELVNKANSETLAQFFDGGACSLRFNNNTKFATTNTGVVVTGICTATTFVGALTGNSTTATTATTATNVTVADESSDTTCFPTFVTAATGNLAPKSGTNLTFNSSSGALTATSFVGDGSALTNLPSSSVGGASSISLDDNTKLYFGSTEDYEMFWNGNRMSFQPVSSSTTAELEIVSNDQMYICSKDNGLFLKSGDQNVIDLYGGFGGGIYFKHNNTQKLKLEGGNWTYLNSATVTHAADVFIPDKIVHVGDTNTSIRFPAADTFSVETAGSERLRIKSDGKVGIGTDDPEHALVVRDSGLARIRIRNDVASSGNYASVNLKTAGFDGGWSLYSEFKSSNADNYLKIFKGDGTGTHMYFKNKDEVGIRSSFYHVDANGANQGDSCFGFAANTANPGFKVKIGGSERLRIDSSGRIGTNGVTISNANAGFDDLVITSSGGGNTGITLLSSTTAQGTIAFADGSSGTAPFSGYVQYSHNDNTLMLGTNGADKIRIGSHGEIGVAGAGSLNNGSAGQVLTSGGNSAGCKWVDQGVSIVDMWRVTSNFSGNKEPINSNWERVDNTIQGGGTLLGSAMSESSGIFTFPKTGWWRVDFASESFLNSDDREVRGWIFATTDNGSYSIVSFSAAHIARSESSNTHAFNYCTAILDITNTTDRRVRFHKTVNNGNTTTLGSTNMDRTYAIFTRLGDT